MAHKRLENSKICVCKYKHFLSSSQHKQWIVRFWNYGYNLYCTLLIFWELAAISVIYQERSEIKETTTLRVFKSSVNTFYTGNLSISVAERHPVVDEEPVLCLLINVSLDWLQLPLWNLVVLCSRRWRVRLRVHTEGETSCSILFLRLSVFSFYDWLWVALTLYLVPLQYWIQVPVPAICSFRAIYLHFSLSIVL